MTEFPVHLSRNYIVLFYNVHLLILLVTHQMFTEKAYCLRLLAVPASEGTLLLSTLLSGGLVAQSSVVRVSA